jgi:hypothetical protein
MTETPVGQPMNMLGKVLQAITDHKNELAAVVLHLNDTYLIEKRPDRKLPGFARLIATIRLLRAHIEEVTDGQKALRYPLRYIPGRGIGIWIPGVRRKYVYLLLCLSG